MVTDHMHCGGFWDLTQVYLEQKLVIEFMFNYPSESKKEIVLLKIPTLPEIEPETAACTAVTATIPRDGNKICCNVENAHS